jgi:cytosine/adenosine deaminase-related metal-dependent hydrolase
MPTMPATVTSTIPGVTRPMSSGDTARVSATGSGRRAGESQGDALLVRGGHVITMDPGAADIPGGDVLVSGGVIAAVGIGLAAPAGATELDATGMIVAPGLVDTHWHMWNTLLRGMSEGGPGYFRLCRSLGPAFGAEDLYQGTLLGCAEAISSGITTVHDWCHNIRTPAHAEAGLRALAQAGLRARFSYGYPAAHPNDQAMDLAGLRADLIMVSAAGPNLGMVTDPAQLLVTAAQPGNVDTVITGGRVLKRGGVLTALDAEQIGRDARRALDRVMARSGPATR